MKKRLSLILACILSLSVILTGCGASNSMADMETGGIAVDSVQGIGSANGFLDFGGGFSKEESSAPEVNYQPPMESPKVEEISPDELPEPDQEYLERKIVYSATIDAQTMEFEKAVEQIKSKLNEYNGFIGDENIRNYGDINSNYSRKHLTMTVRVPSENFEAFIAGITSENIHVLNLSKNSKDYSEVYYDNKGKVASLEVQEERLLELLAEADNVDVMLRIEQNLANVRYEIESLKSELKFIDSKVDYSTVTISLEQVIKYDEIKEEPTSFFEELIETIKDSSHDFLRDCKYFLFDFIYAIPYLAVWGVVICVVVSIIRKIRRKRKAKLATMKVETKLKDDEIKSDK